MILNIRKDSNGKGKQHTTFNSLTIKLWNIEVFTLEGMHLEQRLTLQPALVVLLGGEASLEREDRKNRMGKEFAYFCPGGTTFGINRHGVESVSVAVIYFNFYKESLCRRQLEEADAEKILQYNGALTLSSADRLSLFCRSIYEHFRSDDDFKQWRAQLDFQELLQEMLFLGNLNVKSDKTQGLERSREYMDNHYHEELTIDQLAGMAELSPKYYMDMFKKTYSLSAMEYLAQVRMNKAKQLMLGSGRILKEVAHMVGYKDEFYFSRKFKKEFGLSPSAYIKKRKNKLAVYGSTSLLGYLLPLNIIPYAAPLHPKWSWNYYHNLGPDIPVHLNAFRQNHNKTGNLEKLELSQPELIICSQDLELWEKERLQQIAPVYELPEESVGWEEQLLWMAHLLDKNVEAQQWIESFYSKLRSFRHEIFREIKDRPTLLTARLHDHELVSYRSHGIREVLFNNLDFLSPSLIGKMTDDVPLTVDKIKTMEADHIFLLVRQDSETLEYWRELQSSPDWMTIPAVREGRFHQISSYPWREYSPIALELMAEEAAKIFSGNCP
ncbi:AraC family transcriptional regulator [Paenibacillus sp. N3/727]|uniref:AraC family transcriptional regulator n=1 Tax=Paenibacillus sp. N3/727 TaxID=2925845 RepID=UPI001F53A875|nr:AraC family transcriptional regulator [Paenibacillus sp. N3/727]UNK17546.1 AraC family transcriptional regulator [Paenibacillus sp. N3/727]